MFKHMARGQLERGEVSVRKIGLQKECSEGRLIDKKNLNVKCVTLDSRCVN